MSTLVGSVRGRLRDELDCYVLLAVAAAWYLSNLDGGLSVDETIYAESGYGLLTGDPYLNPTHAIAPTGKYPTGLSQLLLGPSSEVVRLPAALFGLGTLYVTYRLGRHLRGRWVGLSAATLVGTTYLFAHHSVRMMLDVPLTFLFVGSILVGLLWLEDPTDGRGYLLGALLVATATTKIYGALYVLPVVVTVLVGAARTARVDLRESLRPPVLGGAALAFALFAPFAVVPHPPVVRSYHPLVHAVVSVPVLGNYAYVAGQAIAKNFLHLGDGHAVLVGSTVYQYPPVWTYLYWLYDFGGSLYLVGAVVVATAPLVGSRRRGALSLSLCLLVPLVGLSLLTVKFPRYVIPLFPVIALGTVYHLRGLAGRVLDRAVVSGAASRRTVHGIATVVLVLGLTLPAPAPFVDAHQKPIREDSGLDTASTHIREYAANDSGELVVASYQATALRYYLPEGTDVRLVNLAPFVVSGDASKLNAFRRGYRNGSVDFVVLPNREQRRPRADVYAFVSTHGRLRVTIPQSPQESDLAIYESSARVRSRAVEPTGR